MRFYDVPHKDLELLFIIRRTISSDAQCHTFSPVSNHLSCSPAHFLLYKSFFFFCPPCLLVMTRMMIRSVFWAFWSCKVEFHPVRGVDNTISKLWFVLDWTGLTQPRFKVIMPFSTRSHPVLNPREVGCVHVSPNMTSKETLDAGVIVFWTLFTPFEWLAVPTHEVLFLNCTTASSLGGKTRETATHFRNAAYVITAQSSSLREEARLLPRPDLMRKWNRFQASDDWNTNPAPKANLGISP